jgi:hypothetical protein
MRNNFEKRVAAMAGLLKWDYEFSYERETVNMAIMTDKRIGDHVKMIVTNDIGSNKVYMQTVNTKVNERTERVRAYGFEFDPE